MKRTLLLAVAIVINAAACSGDDGSGTVASEGDERTVEIEMRDIAFSPDKLDVRAGETVRLVFRNTGKVKHDAFIGDEKAQADHEEEMSSDAGNGMDRSGGEEGIIIEPGESGELTHTFEEAGTLLIGCHEPGHYDAGMRISVDVT